MANLGKLIKQADAAAESASRLVLRAMREIRGELALLADELNLTGSAADRDKAYQMIQKKMARLSRRLDALMDAQNHLAGKTAAKSAEEMTGLEVKYSAARANAIIELVTPAQGENLAAVFTENMAQRSINALQEATVAVMREQAVAGGTMKEMKKALGERWQKAISAPPVFTDAGGHTWDTGAYLQMNIRTNTMRVYNDCLVDDVARTTGSDLVRVSTGGDPTCRLCAPWEGVILSVSGKTKGFPTYEQARQAGCFHPNCVHTIETVDDVWDDDEIELQKAHPVTKETATDPDAMDERKYKMDQERYRRQGMDKEAARLAVDRDNLEANIRHGLIRSDAREIVDKLTDAQVTALCKDGNPPRFEPTKKATKKDPHAADEKFIHGKRGGVVHIARNATVEDIIDVTRIEATDGIVSTTVSGVKKLTKKDSSAKHSKHKTPEEIKAMKIEDAIKQTEYLVSNIASMQIPESITIREKRLERAEQIFESRKKAWTVLDLEDKTLEKKLKNAKGKDLIVIQEQLTKVRHRKIKAARRYNRSLELKQKISFNLSTESAPWAYSIIAHGKDPCVINVDAASKGLPLWNDAKSYLEKIVDKSVFPSDGLTVRKISGRAYQSLSKICLSDKDDIQTHIHETMHFVEGKNPHIHDRCVEFLQYRTKGESKKSLRDLTGKNYGKDEYTRPDHFFNPYCGKAYERTDVYGNVRVLSTEILSMGVERLMRNPVRFLQEDREYAIMCLNLIRGNL